MPSRDVSQPLLRALLVANAAFSGISGMLLLSAAPLLSDWLGVDAPWALQVLGVGLLLFAVWLMMSADEASPDPRDVRTAIAIDGGWVVGCVLALATSWPWLTSAGRWTIGITADLVAAFALFQWYGLHRTLHTEVSS